MPRTRLYIRSMLALLLVAACFAAMIFPLLDRAQAAPGAAAIAPDDVIISSFRFIGSGGETDEYIELYNQTASTIDLTGITLRSSNGNTKSNTAFFTFGNVSLGAGQYYLLGGPGYNDSVGADACYSPGIGSGNGSSGYGGVAIFSATDTTTPIDQAGLDLDGFTELGAAQNVLPRLTGNIDQSYVRTPGSGGKTYADTNDNFADFTQQNPSAPQSTTGTLHCSGITPTNTPTFTISGNVRTPGVTILYTGNSTTSDANGNYSFSVPNGWNGTVTPQKGNFTFNPDHRDYLNVTANKVSQNYTATLDTPGLLSVLINEVGWMGTYANAPDQWLEFYNPNNYGVNIADLRLMTGYCSSQSDVLFNLSNAGLTDDILPPHGFLLLEDNSHVFQNLPPSTYTYNGITYSLTTKVLNLSLSTYGQYLCLRSATTNFDVDHVFEYKWPAGNNSSPSQRASMERHNQDYDSTRAWLTFAGTAHPRVVQDADGNPVRGTPGEPNWADTVNPTPIPTSTPYRYKTPTPRPPTPYGHMVINEFLPRAGYDYNQDGTVDVYDEFVELKNLGPVAAQLNGWKIDVISPGGPSSYPLSGITLQPDQRVLFYSLKSHLSLYDSGGTVRLINNRGIVVDARSYGPVQNADQSTCRIPDGYYWQFPCFPTPGLENSLTGTLPVPPPVIASQPPPCLLADTVPDPFKQAECNGFGADVFNPAYWDNQSGFNSYPVPDVIDKNGSEVK